MDTPKGMGEVIGKVRTIHPLGRDEMELNVEGRHGITLCNGDGFAFTDRNGDIVGFRGDICAGTTIRCRKTDGLTPGTRLYRNISTEFEKILATRLCRRMIPVNVNVSVSGDASGGYTFTADATSPDGRKVSVNIPGGNAAAENAERMKSMILSQLSKTSEHYSFSAELVIETSDGSLPFVSSAFLNGIRRSLAESLDGMPAIARPLMNLRDGAADGSPTAPEKIDYKFNVANRIAGQVYSDCGAKVIDDAYEIGHKADAELMRTKYCIRYELGICPKHKGRTGLGSIDLNGRKIDYPLMLENNGRRFVLDFDCKNCEMTVREK